VATLLRDRVVADMMQKVDDLTERLQKSQAVQIVSASGTVYAEGQFEDGCYYSSNHTALWAIELTKQLASCALSDLNNVQICVGGIQKAEFRADSTAVRIDQQAGTTRYKDGWGTIGFGFGGTSWLLLKLGPFPSEEAFRSQVRGFNISYYLMQELAVNHPELSVTFWGVCFPIGEVKGAMQTLNLDRSKRKRKRVTAAAAIEEENDAEDDVGVASDAEG
jgi:hypothetical protein